MDPKKLDELLNGELAEFEKWFVKRQVAKGYPPAGLVGPERGVIKAYFIYAATKGDVPKELVTLPEF